MGERKRGRAGFWCTLSVVGGLCYVFLLGPACWISSRTGGERFVSAAYRPLTWVCDVTESSALDKAIRSYSETWAAWGWHWYQVETFGNLGTTHRSWLWQSPAKEIERLKEEMVRVDRLQIRQRHVGRDPR